MVANKNPFRDRDFVLLSLGEEDQMCKMPGMQKQRLWNMQKFPGQEQIWQVLKYGECIQVQELVYVTTSFKY